MKCIRQPNEEISRSKEYPECSLPLSDISSHTNPSNISVGFIAKILDTVFQQRKILNSLHHRSFSSLPKQMKHEPMEQINITPSCNHVASHSKGLREDCLSFRESFICTTQRLRQISSKKAQ